MGKTAVKKKAARKPIPDPELVQIAQRKREQKKIAAGYREISRLARRIVVVRATTEHELRQLANGILSSIQRKAADDAEPETVDGE